MTEAGGDHTGRRHFADFSPADTIVFQGIASPSATLNFLSWIFYKRIL